MVTPISRHWAAAAMVVLANAINPPVGSEGVATQRGGPVQAS